MQDRDGRSRAQLASLGRCALPSRRTVGPRGRQSGTVELTARRGGATEELSPEAAVARLAQIYRGL